MVRKCVIEGCDSKSSLPAHHGVTYHSFPFDSKTREKWLENCHISANKNITKSVLVCSRHFRRADFQPMKSGKYLLKQGVTPTVFPWGKIESTTSPSSAASTNSDPMSSVSVAGSTTGPVIAGGNTPDEVTADSVEATIAQIMAETAELNAIAGIKPASAIRSELSLGGDSPASSKRSSTDVLADDRPPKLPRPSFDSPTSPGTLLSSPEMSPLLVQPRKIDAATMFTPGVRLEAQDFDGLWHTARVVEVDNDDREVLIKFEKSAKNKSTALGSEEWIPMNSTRLRQKLPAYTKPPPVFVLEEKCLARWSGSRKYSATVKKCLGNDLYEVLFYDGFVKTIKGNHMSKIRQVVAKGTPSSPADVATVATSLPSPVQESNVVKGVKAPTKVVASVDASLVASASSKTSGNASAKTKARQGAQSRKDWPLISMASLDLEALNLPDIPKDGEWTCHWVNDQPIGKEGFLLVGDHKKPTVIVEDWRLPIGWVKHMYQRSNVLGKWDVILVNPQGKRFRSKADLKIFIEELGQVYNPDVYDFSIHRRRAKDIGAYAYTPDYTRTQPKNKLESTIMANKEIAESSDDNLQLSFATSDSTTPSKKEHLSSALMDDAVVTAVASSLATTSNLYTETPVATLVPPMELMTSPGPPKLSAIDAIVKSLTESPTVEAAVAEDGYAYIGGLKVQIIDNLFRCPQEGCFKNFRKENHLQIHVKHYHQDLIKLLGECPNMQEIASKRTLGNPENEVQPKNQIPNQQFFAKLHQQDLQQSRAHRKSIANVTPTPSSSAPIESTTASPLHVIATNDATLLTDTSLNLTVKSDNTTLDSSVHVSDLSHSIIVTGDISNIKELVESPMPSPSSGGVVVVAKRKGTKIKKALLQAAAAAKVPFKKARLSPTKRTPGARKSNRQRTTRKYLTAATATLPIVVPLVTASALLPAASGFDTSSTVLTNTSFGISEFEETRHSFNATPDAKPISSLLAAGSSSSKKHRAQTVGVIAPPPITAPPTPLRTTADSPVTADGSHTTGSSCFAPSESPQYIKENGELIKIVRMRQEEIINCLCSYGEEDGLMIQCELCLCWQHGICNGIDKESDVPEKYVCYICRNPQRGRESLKYIHDQDWLYEGKLPVAYYHEANPMLPERFELLKKSHTLTGNLTDLKRFMYSLRVKINIARNKDHPKMYLWEKRWDKEEVPIKEEEQMCKDEIKIEGNDASDVERSNTMKTDPEHKEPPTKKIKIELPTPNVPQPEAPIDPVECQHRLLEHIKIQQNLVMHRLHNIESQIDELESLDHLTDFKSADDAEIKDVLALIIKDVEAMKQLSKINALANIKHVTVNPIVIK